MAAGTGARRRDRAADALRDRLEGWLIKALREGKERSDWNDPDQSYEGGRVVPARSPTAGLALRGGA